MKKQKPTPKKEVLHPDDHFFSVLMRETENARAYLTNFYPKIAQRLNLESLTLENTTFINPQFKTFDSDIVYRCQFKNSDQGIYCTLLWEHKSAPEKYVAIQIGLYIMQALYTLCRDKDKVLEPVLPLLFYNGKDEWKPKTIRELFKEHPFFDLFKEYLPSFKFLFKDLSKTPHKQLLAIRKGFFRSAMVAMANRYKPDLLMSNISIIFEVEPGDSLKSIGTYFFAVVERSTNEIKQIAEKLEFGIKSNIMSTLTLLKAEGNAEGKAEGRAEGRAEGDYKRNVIAIRNMTQKKLLKENIAEFLSLTPEYVQKIQTELLSESKIIAELAKKQSLAHITKKLKVSKWLVEVILELRKK